MRALSKKFIGDLKDSEGLLHPIFRRIKDDDTLMLAVRDGYINIYYRGGSIIRITEQANSNYQSFFNVHYRPEGTECPRFPEFISSQEEAKRWVSLLPSFKQLMDLWFGLHPKPEREFQQLAARENNYSSISGQSEYFISDIEFADSSIGARFDMLAIRWLATQRKCFSNCRPALIEMKYGDSALTGNAGLIKHLHDIDDLLANKKSYASLVSTMESQFRQLDELGLLKYKRPGDKKSTMLSSKDKPEVILILANYNPRSSKLKSILRDPRLDDYSGSSNYDLKFFSASFAGYAMHSSCMLTLDAIRDKIK